jgi:hypothetical protein
VQLYLLMCVAGNLLSTLFPFPVRGDAMRRSVGAGAHLLSVLLSLLLSAVVVVPATGCLLLDHLARRFLGYHGLPLALPASLLLLGITVVLYRLSLKPLGLLLLRREPAIIQKLTATER